MRLFYPSWHEIPGDDSSCCILALSSFLFFSLLFSLHIPLGYCFFASFAFHLIGRLIAVLWPIFPGWLLSSIYLMFLSCVLQSHIDTFLIPCLIISVFHDCLSFILSTTVPSNDVYYFFFPLWVVFSIPCRSSRVICSGRV